MKIFDTKDSKVSNRKFESFHRKHSELEESPNDFSEVSNRKFESSIGEIQNLNAHLIELVNVPLDSLIVSIRNIKNMYMLT